MLAALDRGWKNFRRLRAENRLALQQCLQAPIQVQLKGPPPGTTDLICTGFPAFAHMHSFLSRAVHHKNADRLVIFQSLFVHSFSLAL